MKRNSINIALFVETPLPPVSRANIRLYRLGLSLVKKGFNVHMIVPSFYLHKRKNLFFSDIATHQYPGLAAFLYSKIRLVARTIHLFLSVLHALVLHKRVRIYAVHGWNPLAGFAAVITGKIIGCPIFIDFTDFYSDIARFENPFLVPVFQKLERFVLFNSTKVVVVSDEMKNVLTKMGVPDEKIHIIPDGTDIEMFNPNIDCSELRSRYNLYNCPVIIFHGDIKPWDGLDILLHAFALVLKHVPNTKLFIIGNGSPHSFKVKKLARDLKINSSVVFTGWINYNQVREFLAIADVGVMPLRSTLETNCYLSFKLFEYCAMGKPVIVSDVKAISKIIKKHNNGILVKPGDIESLTKELLTILTNRNMARVLGKNGRKLVEEKYNWDTIMNEEAKLYEGLDLEVDKYRNPNFQ